MVDLRRDSDVDKHIETGSESGPTSPFHDELFTEQRREQNSFYRHRGDAGNSYNSERLYGRSRPEPAYEGVKALADHIVLYASSRSTSTNWALQGKIGSLSNEEQFQLLHELRKRAQAVPGYYEKHIAPLAQIDTQTGELMDLDLVVFDSDTPKILDIYTPHEKGANCDKEQEMKEAISMFPELSTEHLWQCEQFPAARR